MELTERERRFLEAYRSADAYIKLLDDEELSDILPRLADFITGVKGLLWFVGKNL